MKAIRPIHSLCMLGDSLAKGVIVDSAKKNYTFLKECFVNLFSAATGIVVDNFSKFGCTVTKGLEIARRYGDKLKGYDYVVLEFGGNDSNFNWREISERPRDLHMPATPLGEFEEKYKVLVDQVRESGGRPLMLNLPPVDGQRFFDWVSRNLNRENILRWLYGDVNTISRWHAGYNDAVCRVAAEKKVPLIDIRSIFTGKGKLTDYYCIDGMHLNAKGHKIVTERICAYA